MVFSAVSAGAVGYLLKGADGADIVTAVRADHRRRVLPAPPETIHQPHRWRVH